MGKTIVKHEDIDLLFDKLTEKEASFFEDEELSTPGRKEFFDIVREVFGIALPENQVAETQKEE